MILLIDVGNSRIKWRLLRGDGTLSPVDAYAHNGADPRQWVGELWVGMDRPDKLIVANVAGNRVAHAIDAWAQRYWRLEPRFAVSKIHELGVHNGYDSPEHLGVDRWVAMIGARTVTQQNCVVIDCGTAVTADALTAIGDHLGGVILPGVRLMHAALYKNTALAIQQPPDGIVVLGTNTRDCIWGGTVYALAAAIDRLSAEMAAAMNGPAVNLLTGGNGAALLPYLRGDYRVEPDLVFIGLTQIARQRFGVSGAA